MPTNDEAMLGKGEDWNKAAIPADLRVDWSMLNEPYVVPVDLAWAIERDKNMQRFAKKLIERIARAEAANVSLHTQLSAAKDDLANSKTWTLVRARIKQLEDDNARLREAIVNCPLVAENVSLRSQLVRARTCAEETAMTEDQIKHMVNRFLGWRLPDNFNPDAGISFKATFKATFNENTPWPMRHEPTGTNLFDATQADAMVRYMIDGLQTESSLARARKCAEETAKTPITAAQDFDEVRRLVTAMPGRLANAYLEAAVIALLDERVGLIRALGEK